MDKSEHQPLIRRSSEDPEEIENKWLHTKFPMIAVLLLVGFERLAFYAISGDLVYYLNGIEMWNSNNANIMTFTFIGFYSIMSVIGGLLADRLLGKYRTIMFALVMYLIGYSLLTWVGHGISSKTTTLRCYTYQDSMNETTPNHHRFFSSPCIVEMSIALFLISIGSGCLRANIAPFGADQLANTDPAQTRRFFNWLYWSINIGAFSAIVGISWVQLYTDHGFFTGYLIALSGLTLGTIIMIIGYKFLVIRGATGRYPVWTISVVVNAVRTRFRFTRHRGSEEFSFERLPRSWMDWAMDLYGGSYTEREVADVKQTLRVLLLLALLIPWWLTYDQVNTTFLTQGLHMTVNGSKVTDDTNVCCNRPKIPPPWLSVFDALVLITLLPLLDRKIYPALDRRGVVLRPVTRIAIGIVFAILSVLVAGVLEHFRLKSYRHLAGYSPPQHINQCFHSQQSGDEGKCSSIDDLPKHHNRYNMSLDQNCNSTYISASLVYNAADVSIFWQIPQYALLGISEAFTSVASMELAYTEAPARWRSTMMGWYYFFSGIGSFMGSAIIYAYTASDDSLWNKNRGQGSINCGIVEYYFYVLAAILFAGLVGLMVARFCLNLTPRHTATSRSNKRKPPPKPAASRRAQEGQSRRISGSVPAASRRIGGTQPEGESKRIGASPDGDYRRIGASPDGDSRRIASPSPAGSSLRIGSSPAQSPARVAIQPEEPPSASNPSASAPSASDEGVRTDTPLTRPGVSRRIMSRSMNPTTNS